MESGRRNRRANALWIAVPLLLAAGAAGVWMHGRERPAGRSDGADTQAAAESATAAGTSAHAAATHPSPLPRGRFQDIRAELEARARAGDAQAAYRLGEVLGRCRNYQPIAGGEFTEMLARAIANGGTYLRIGGRSVDDPQLLDVMLYSKDRADAVCGDVGDLSGAVRAGDARAWLELAAERGHARAMVDYGEFAFEDLPTDGDLLDHADEVARRRELARAYLRRAFEAGEPESLLALAAAHGNKPYLGRDAAEAAAYFKAYRGTDAGRRMPAGVLSFIEQQLAPPGDARQTADVERRAAQILQAFQQRRAPR
ncbi:hypothetical protein J5226_00740 [Lysobacter sp. K5869]|uniref:hypothetical protein n=1 Tax=Lysobacter sp. K5869 TaxID=2820808 RepID=UPI001C060312|nr:hypothetical protein [Lysobacter sp. K5869]QWP76969.1 hypothetical protein J5226_00740 [Lysobacter sp. K5869]